ncbi:MAG: SIS domain-containing protein [Sulfolobales archaeon]
MSVDLYHRWSEFLIDSLSLEVENVREFETKKIIYISGMGGSGIVGEYVARIVDEHFTKRFLVISKRSSDITNQVLELGRETFFIIVSYSGNTAETLRVFRKLTSKRLDIGVVTSGGVLGREAARDRLPMVIVRSGLIPRVSFPYLLVAVLKLIGLLGVNIDSILTMFKDTANIIRSFDSYAEDLSEKLFEAVRAGDRIVIVSSERYEPLVERFIAEYAENSKILLHRAVFPEAGHNIVETLRSAKTTLLYIEDSSDLENQVIEGFLQRLREREENIRIVRLELPANRSYLEKILVGTYIAGLSSSHLAERLEISPVETPSIKLYRDYVSEFYLTH